MFERPWQTLASVFEAQWQTVASVFGRKAGQGTLSQGQDLLGNGG